MPGGGKRPEVALVDDPRSAFPLRQALADTYDLMPVTAHGSGTTADASTARALVTTTNAGATAALIAALPLLELVVVAGGHVDRIDRRALRARRIPLHATPGVATDDVADLAMGLVLASLRGLCAGDRMVRDGRWGKEVPRLGRSLAGTRLGILGLGAVGSALAVRAAAFEMSLAYGGPRRKAAVPWPYFGEPRDLARAVDVLAVTCASTPETRGMVDGRVLKALGPDDGIVSVSRDVVEQAALIAALAAGEIGTAALDVVADEPHVGEALRGDPRVIVTPHIGAKTTGAKTTTAALVRANLEAHFAGRPLLTPAL